MSKLEVYQLRPQSPISQTIWMTMCYFSNLQFDDGAKYLESALNKDEKNTQAWLVAFDFCRLSGKTSTLSMLTEKFAMLFNRPPPDWVSQPVEAFETNAAKGLQLNIISASTPESEQYGAAFVGAIEKKVAVLIKFTSGKVLSWQEPAVSRLSKGIETLVKAKLPIYCEHIEVPLTHIRSIPFDQRTNGDWSVLFYALLYTNQESVFEEEALQYTLVKGISPPSFEKLNYPPQSTWFSSNNGQTADVDSGNSIALNGTLANSMPTLLQKATQKLQKQESLILDMRGTSHADWTSIMEVAALHNKIWDTASRKLLLTKPSALIGAMLHLAGIPDRSYTTMPK